MYVSFELCGFDKYYIGTDSQVVGRIGQRDPNSVNDPSAGSPTETLLRLLLLLETTI